MYFIAEIGINHNGDIAIAKKLIDMAKKCGCNAVKFQKRDIETVYTSEMLDSLRESPFGTTQRQQKEGLEFGKAEYDIINSYCEEKGIDWFASAWDNASLSFLSQYDCPHNKIASAMLTNLDFVSEVARQGKHTFISTGMCNFEQIDAAVDIFRDYVTPFTLLHCVSVYPCEDKDCNLLMIQVLGNRYKCPVGYSGHERGILPSVLSVSLGATVIERHITLDRTMYGSDQSASLEEHGLGLMVRDCNDVWGMLGDGEKRIITKEAENARKLRYFE